MILQNAGVHRREAIETLVTSGLAEPVALERLSHSRDPVTAKLSRWALSFRFDPAGPIRPFLAAAERGEDTDAP